MKHASFFGVSNCPYVIRNRKWTHSTHFQTINLNSIHMFFFRLGSAENYSYREIPYEILFQKMWVFDAAVSRVCALNEHFYNHVVPMKIWWRRFDSMFVLFVCLIHQVNITFFFWVRLHDSFSLSSLLSSSATAVAVGNLWPSRSTFSPFIIAFVLCLSRSAKAQLNYHVEVL